MLNKENKKNKKSTYLSLVSMTRFNVIELGSILSRENRRRSSEDNSLASSTREIPILSRRFNCIADNFLLP